jgi:outer membrane receptor protein involved in Fe transport
MTWATAYRTPSIWEVSDLSTGITYYPPPVPMNNLMVSNLSLKPEEVQSFEVGYVRCVGCAWMQPLLT